MIQKNQNKDLSNTNENIKARNVVLITTKDAKPQKLPLSQALDLAYEQGLDLLQVGVDKNGDAICKILNYSKHKYELHKKQKQAAKNQVKTNLKEVRLTVNIARHDLLTKSRKVREWILKNDRVKVSLKFRGREVAYFDQGKKVLDMMFEEVKDIAKIDKPAKLTDKFLDMYLVADK